MSSGRGENDPACFGQLDKVFPMGDDGLRSSPDSCMYCSVKTSCLRSAMAGPRGVTVKEENLDRGYKAGRVGFLERWSRKKQMHREKDKQNKKS